MDAEVRERGAIAIYGAFAKISDPDMVLRRWKRLKDALKDQFRAESEAAYRAFKFEDPFF